MAEKKIIVQCKGTLIIKNVETKCERVIAEIERLNDAKIVIKCGKCGKENIIQATPPKQPESTAIIMNGHNNHSIQLGTFSIQHISE